ncbi:MAG: AmmeMemoRadiSam system protein B [Bryobacteraceae bacterium]
MAASHTSPYAGSWYPGRTEELSRLLDHLFSSSTKRTGEHLMPHARAFVVPHAGLAYSGTVAAAVYRHIAALRPRRVAILAFSHSGGPNEVVVPEVDAIRTPVGEAVMDAADLPFRRVSEAQVCDHSLEIQLPLLLRAAPETHVAPLYVGHLSERAREDAAQALAALAGPDTVFVASSDFTHYGRGFGFTPFPVNDETPERIRELDFDVIRAASSLDPAAFLACLRQSGATVCGYNPIALLLRTLALTGTGDFYQETLDYQTSGEITGEFDHSVSYAAIGYFPREAFELDAAERELLHESARRTLNHLFETGRRKPIPPRSMTPNLARRAGVFVSLHEGGELRGCIGHRIGYEPLAAAVPQLALSAALEDPRFEPLRAPKRPVEIEISVLTPMRRIRDINAFVLGRHGAYFSSGIYHSLLLPQVAEDRDWEREDFFNALCRKAGCGGGAWRSPGAELYVFEAQVFGGAAAAAAAG